MVWFASNFLLIFNILHDERNLIYPKLGHSCAYWGHAFRTYRTNLRVEENHVLFADQGLEAGRVRIESDILPSNPPFSMQPNKKALQIEAPFKF